MGQALFAAPLRCTKSRSGLETSPPAPDEALRILRACCRRSAAGLLSRAVIILLLRVNTLLPATPAALLITAQAL
jgi:hypothetical protein